jgi:hypothetical protein
VLHDDLLNPLANVTHRSNLMPIGWGSIGKAIRACGVALVVVT